MNMSWLNDEALEQIDSKKIEFMCSLAKECDGKTPKEMLPIIMSASKRSKESGLQLTTQEAGIMMHILQSYSSDEERSKVEQFLKRYNPSASYK